MRRFITILLILGILGGLAFFVLKDYLPNLTPPSKNIKQYLPLNENTPSPVQIMSGYTLNLFYDLKYEKPKTLLIDENEDLLVELKSGKIIKLSDEDENLKADIKTDVTAELAPAFNQDLQKDIRDKSGNIIAIDEENQLIKYKIFAGGISDQSVLLTGFTKPSGEKIGNLKYVVINKKGDLFIADDKSNLIYVMTSR